MKNRDESRTFLSHDGLKLHYLDFSPAETSARPPVVCLPGLARCADDFVGLAIALSRDSRTPRRVIAFDYRGRGLSDWDEDWRHYSVDVERGDILQGLAQLGIDNAHFVGTSRGGLHILSLAASNRGMIRAAVLNDIGPVLEADGLRRIKGYVGRPASPRSFGEAIALLKIGGGHDFDGLTEAEWQAFAQTTFGTDETCLGLRYDPRIARTLDVFDLDKPLPDSWDLFDKLSDAPVLTLRGANSDLLSTATLAAMGARWPASETLTVPGQGHAPLLLDQPTISRIDLFLARAD